jgi:hypothetical protein
MLSKKVVSGVLQFVGISDHVVASGIPSFRDNGGVSLLRQTVGSFGINSVITVVQT